MLVGFPIAYYTATFLTLLAYRGTADPFWIRVSVVANFAGVVAAGLAAIPGVIDALGAVPRATPQRRTALWHGVLNGAALLFFVANLILQWDPATPHDQIGVLLVGAGMVSTLFACHYGATLVQTYHVGVMDLLLLPPPTTDGSRPRSAPTKSHGVAKAHAAPKGLRRGDNGTIIATLKPVP
jgi:uncharacterized membrane protein